MSGAPGRQELILWSDKWRHLPGTDWEGLAKGHTRGTLTTGFLILTITRQAVCGCKRPAHAYSNPPPWCDNINDPLHGWRFPLDLVFLRKVRTAAA
jgi:hypothetical protein